MTGAAETVAPPVAQSASERPRRRRGLSRAAAVGIPGYGLAAIYLSFLILIPIVAVLSHAFDGGLSTMWGEIRQPLAWQGLELSVESAAIVVVVNSILGTAIAWMFVRDHFFVNKITARLVDLPFALPTVVAGIVLVALYGPSSPVGINIAFTRLAIWTALCFVTLPFSVRAVQPVLAAIDQEAEEAAQSLGAGPFTTFRRVTLPSLLPAILTGAGLAFARALGEYGSVSIVSGSIPGKTELASVEIFGLYEQSDTNAAAAISLALFVIALVVLAIFTVLRRRILPPEAM
jgi:sulfate/thiosulfate transport system permease protein